MRPQEAKKGERRDSPDSEAHMAQSNDLDLITQKSLMRLLDVRSRETLARWIRKGQFPPPLVVGGGRLRWSASEVKDWMQSRDRRGA